MHISLRVHGAHVETALLLWYLADAQPVCVPVRVWIRTAEIGNNFVKMHYALL